MSEAKNLTVLQQQKATKPTIEDVLPKNIDSDTKKAIFDFITYLSEINMPLKWTSSYGWKAGSGKHGVCKIKFGIFDNIWVVILILNHRSEYEEVIIKEGWQNIFWDNANYCVHRFHEGKTHVGCNPNKGCAGGEDRTIIGKEFNGICHCTDVRAVQIRDPDETEIEIIKRLIELEQNA